MTKKIIQGIGASLAILVGLIRGIGACLLLSDADKALEGWIGFVLLVLSLWIITVGISFVAKPIEALRRWLTAGLIAFWLDGVLNGYLLFGVPRTGPQILNAVCVAGALLCLWLGRAPMQDGAHN